jgi:cell division transport system ATP-binding protein
MIRFDSVYKTYDSGQDALKNISLEVDHGEFVFLTEHSGADKSTLLRLIALSEQVSRGQVIVDGQNLESVPRRQVPYYRRKVGFIFQEHHLLPDRSVFDNVALPLVVAGHRTSETQTRVRAATCWNCPSCGESSADSASRRTYRKFRPGIVVRNPQIIWTIQRYWGDSFDCDS